jgi:hypothetical protein
METKFIENLPLWRRRELCLVKNEKRSWLSSPEFLCSPLIIAPQVGKNISTIHATDRNRHTISSTRDLSNFYGKFTFAINR